MRVRQQSSTSHPVTFLMVDSTDHVTGKTGLTPTVTLSKDGGAFAAAAGAVSEIGNGWYALAGNATDRGTAGDLLIHASAAGADPVDERYLIVPWDPFDGAGLGLTDFDAVTLAATQGAVTFGQVKITTNVSGQGALDVRNSNANGHGVYADGGNFGLRTQGGNGGQGNYGTYYGQANSGATGVYNYGSTAAVEGVDPAGIRAALGMAAADLDDQLDGIGSGLSAQEVRDAMLLAPTAGAAAAGSVDAKLDAIQAVTDGIDLTDIDYVTSNVSGTLAVIRGVTFEAEVTGLTIPADWTKVVLRCKRKADVLNGADEIAIIESNPAAGSDGLSVLAGIALVAPIVAADGALVVDQPGGSISITVTDEATAYLGLAGAGVWHVRVTDSGGVTTQVAAGAFRVAAI